MSCIHRVYKEYFVETGPGYRKRFSYVHRPLSKIPRYSLLIPPKFCISIVFILSWDLQLSQERLDTMPMQNVGGTNKECYGIFESGLLGIE